MISRLFYTTLFLSWISVFGMGSSYGGPLTVEKLAPLNCFNLADLFFRFGVNTPLSKFLASLSNTKREIRASQTMYTPDEDIKPRYQTYQDDLLALAEYVEKQTYASGRNIRTVLYPMIGLDIDTAVTLFPHAQNFIGIDRHPFWVHSGKEVTLNKDDRIKSSKSKWDDILTVKTHADLFGSGPVHVSRLLQSNFEVLKILEIEVAPEQPGFGYLDDPLPFFNKAPLSIGIIFFKSKTSPKIYTHYHIQANVKRLSELSWSINFLDSIPIDAVMIKGSMDTLRLPQSALSPFNFLSAKILGWLNQTSGILLEGTKLTDSLPRPFSSKFDGEFFGHFLPNLAHVPYPFSYGNKMRLVPFPLKIFTFQPSGR